MRIRNILGMAALVLGIMAASIVPAIAGLREPASPAGASLQEPIVLIDTGIIVSEDGQSAMSAYSVTLGDN